MGQPNKEYLKVFWSKREKDILYNWPDHSYNGRLLHWFFSGLRPQPTNYDPNPKNFFEELEARGYDLTTFRFSIRRKKTPKEGSQTDSL